METFTDEEALDLLIQARRTPSQGTHLLLQEVERICRRILGNPGDDDLEAAISARLTAPRWTDPRERMSKGDHFGPPSGTG
jgi:hypothetical protein